MIPSLDHHMEVSLILVDSSEIVRYMVHYLFGMDFIRPWEIITSLKGDLDRIDSHLKYLCSRSVLP